MIGDSGGLGSTILNSFTQKAFQQVQKEDANRSGGLDLSEIQTKIDETGSGKDLVDNFDSIDTDQSGELSATELIAFRAKSLEGQKELQTQLQSIFEESGISSDSIVEFLSNRTGQQSDLTSLLRTGTDLDALIESRVEEILTSSGETTSLLNFDTTI
jgi:Ca2+-binding EF-hand superfamily protein